MSVKQKAKAFEARQSSVDGSPPLRKKSREEVIGSLSDKSERRGNSSPPPVRPPRKCKKNGTPLSKQLDDTCSDIEKREKSEVFISPKPVSSNTTLKKQSKVQGQKTKKPKPPPPPRVSSLGRNTPVPDNLKSNAGRKKPRPPVPPKPMNYVSKRQSMQRSVDVRPAVQAVVLTEDEKAVSSRLKEETQDSQVTQVFVSLGRHSSGEKPLMTGDGTVKEQIPDEAVETNEKNRTVKNGVKNDLDNSEVHQNGLVPSHSGISIYAREIVPSDVNSGRESPDPLENLEIEATALSEEEEEELNFRKKSVEVSKSNTHLLESGSKSNEEEVASSDADVVLRGQIAGEESASDSEKNYEVEYSLVLEEECSVTMIKDIEVEQKPADVTTTVSNGFVKAVAEEQLEDANGQRYTSESISVSRLEDPRVEIFENSPDECENIVAVSVEHDVAENDAVKTADENNGDAGQTIAEGVMPVKDISEGSAEFKVAVELDIQLLAHGSDDRYDMHKGNADDDVGLANTSTDSVENGAEMNQNIIEAEPVSEGIFISVSDHAVIEGKAVAAEADEKNAIESNVHEEEDRKEENLEEVASLSESKVVTEPKAEALIEGRGDNRENNLLVNTNQVDSNLEENLSEWKYGNGDIIDEGLNSIENCVFDSGIDEACNERRTVDQGTNDISSVTSPDQLNEIATESALSAPLIEGSLLETSSASCEMPQSDVGIPLQVQEAEDVQTALEKPHNTEKPDSKALEPERETKVISSEPLPLDGTSAGKPKRQKHTYENVDFDKMVERRQSQKKNTFRDLSGRSHSFSNYDAEVYSVPRPARRVSDDDAIYRVPRQSVSVCPNKGAGESDAIYRTPHVVSATPVKGSDYAVPKPVVVKDVHVYAVPTTPTLVPVSKLEKEEVGPVASETNGIYAVPAATSSPGSEKEEVGPVGSETGSIYSVPSAISSPSSEKEEVGLVASETGSIYAVPGVTFSPSSEKEEVSLVVSETGSNYAVPVPGSDIEEVIPAASETGVVYVVPAATTFPSPPPKPPRMSLVLDNDKTEQFKVETVAAVESPKPKPRTRITEVSPAINEPRGSPTPLPRKENKNDTSESPTPKMKAQGSSPITVPRKVSKTEASEVESKQQKASPSPVPRKSAKVSQVAEIHKPSTEGSGSPSPIPRQRSNALKSQEPKLSKPEITISGSNEGDTPSKRRVAPPRPPPPNRMSITSNESADQTSLSPGNDLGSDSDSDVEQEMPKGPPKPKTYYIAHEILSTEQSFVAALKLVFEECYGTIKTAGVVADSVLTDIFRDLENIYLLDSRFLQELEERMATWEEHERIGDIIKKYGHFLKMYTQYVNGYDKAMGVFQDTMKENSEFANLVTQFQTSKKCHGLVLSSYMLKPVQRIPSYRLLLIDYLKHLPKDGEEYAETETALKIVSEVATHINESMKKLDSFEQLLKLQNMLVGNPEIVKAGRDYLKEGMLMKLCRKDMQERMFFLLTDVLLYTTPIGGNQYKLNKMLPLLGMQVTVPDSPDLVNEFSIISTTRSFTLTASTPEERDDWIESLNKAIDIVTKRKITFATKTKSDLAGLAETETDGTTKLGEKAPVWIPDARVTMCMSCTKPFTAINRRHHCRACGNVVCGSCSDSTAPLAYLDYTQARVCDKCYDLLLKEFHTDEMNIDAEEEKAPLPPLLKESDITDKMLRKPTKFEIMRRFKSKRSKRKSQILHPTHLTEVVANQGGIQMSGYLRYKKLRHGWKKSWFVLKDSVLYSYKASSDVVALETLPVLGYSIEDVGKEGDDFVFQLKHQGLPPTVFKADQETSAKRWIAELKKATTMSS